MPRIHCNYEGCINLEGNFCTAEEIELDQELGCLTFSQVDEEEVPGVEEIEEEEEWEDELEDEEEEDWEEFEEEDDDEDEEELDEVEDDEEDDERSGWSASTRRRR